MFGVGLQFSCLSTFSPLFLEGREAVRERKRGTKYGCRVVTGYDPLEFWVTKNKKTCLMDIMRYPYSCNEGQDISKVKATA